MSTESVDKPSPGDACKICLSQNFEDSYAFYGWKAHLLAPQECPETEAGAFQYKGRTYVMIKVCKGHLEGWWDGSDIPGGERPQFESL